MTFAAMLLDLDLAKVQEVAHHFVLTFLFLGLESEGNVFEELGNLWVNFSQHC